MVVLAPFCPTFLDFFTSLGSFIVLVIVLPRPALPCLYDTPPPIESILLCFFSRYECPYSSKADIWERRGARDVNNSNSDSNISVIMYALSNEVGLALPIHFLRIEDFDVRLRGLTFACLRGLTFTHMGEAA
jgi:hypothetical protein